MLSLEILIILELVFFPIFPILNRKMEIWNDVIFSAREITIDHRGVVKKSWVGVIYKAQSCQKKLEENRVICLEYMIERKKLLVKSRIRWNIWGKQR